jgi:acyl-CoA thioesterase-1
LRIPFQRVSFFAFLSLRLIAAAAETPIKWACIGNSITQGPSATEAYPAKLQNLLGPAFQVQNDGVSGKTLLKKGDFSYWTQGKLDSVFKLKPDIITIKLGTNDSKPINWDNHKGEFEADLTALIDTLSGISSKPRIFLVIPCPAFVDQGGSAGIRGTVIKNEVIPLIKKVAAAKKLTTIDAYTALLGHQNFFGDGVHPNAEGHDSLASVIYRTWLSKATRIACMGNSITHYAFGTPGTVAKDAYPVRLNMLLGRDYWVENDGQSGAYMMKNSLMPYYKLPLLARINKLVPNIVTIKLGTNDSRPQYWNRDAFIADYKFMLDTLGKINPKPKIFMCLPAPAFMRDGQWQFQGINDSLMVAQTIPAIKQVAAERGLTLIDLRAPLAAHQELVPDGVHPNAVGQDTLAHAMFRALTAYTVSTSPSPSRVPEYPEITLDRNGLSIALRQAASGRATARLYGLGGRLVAETSLTAASPAMLSVAGLAPGRYFVAVESAYGLAVKAVTLRQP